MQEINKILKPKSEEEILVLMNVSGLTSDELLVKTAKADSFRKRSRRLF